MEENASTFTAVQINILKLQCRNLESDRNPTRKKLILIALLEFEEEVKLSLSRPQSI
jgi:hypothetical protein